MLLFYMSVYLFKTNQFELIEIKTKITDLIKYLILDSFIKNRINSIKHFIVFKTINQNGLIRTRTLFLLFNKSIYNVSNSLYLNIPNLNLLLFIKINIKSILMTIKIIIKSILNIWNIFSFNIRKILLYPMKIRTTLWKWSEQIKNFRSQIEQIIQIIRLPIELLSLIFVFLRTIGNFLRGIERPQINRFM